MGFDVSDEKEESGVLSLVTEEMLRNKGRKK